MYGKVFDSMFDGTLASRGPWQALVTFQQMIVLANPDGIVDMTADAISRRTSIPLEIIELGISELMRPDPKSRTPDEEGRRIVLVDDHRDWGWQIVNHAKYQAMRNAAERREYLRVAQADRRARIKAEAGVSTSVNNVNDVSAKINTSTTTDAYADTDASTPSDAIRGRPPTPPAPTALSGKAARKRSAKPPAPSAETWASYANAYANRYGAEPVRNASVNGQLAQVVGKLGAEEAAHVASFFIGHQNALYVRAMHPVSLLLRDAEKLRTEWATGRTVTNAQATQADRTQTNANVFGRMIEQARQEKANG